MKRNIVYTIVGLLLALLAACSSEPENTDVKPTTDQVESFKQKAFTDLLQLMDQNSDGAIDFQDYHALKSALEQPDNQVSADINGDGETNLADANVIASLAGDGVVNLTGELDVNYDGQVDQNDYRIDATDVSMFYPYLDEEAAKKAIAAGAKAYYAARSGMNIRDASAEDMSAVQLEFPKSALAAVDKKLADEIRNNPDIGATAKIAQVWSVTPADDKAPALTITLAISATDLMATVSGKQPNSGDLLAWGGYVWKFDDKQFKRAYAR